MQRFRFMILLLVAALLLASCGPAPATEASSTPTQGEPVATEKTITRTPSPEGTPNPDSVTPKPTKVKLPVLRITATPTIDALPLYVAKENGLFEAHGIDLRINWVLTSQERDDLVLTSKEADGMVNDMFGTLLANRHGVELKVVRYSLLASPNAPHYVLVASAKRGITAVNGLRNVGIGVNLGSVEEYVTARLLQNAGLAPNEFIANSVPSYNDRIALLASGQLAAALLPEPYASSAIAQGNVKILDDTQLPGMGQSVYSFNRLAIEQKPEAIAAFLAAIEEAVQKINASPDEYTPILAKFKIMPADAAGTFKLPSYPTAGVPDQAAWDDMLAWAKTKELMQADVPYSVSVVADFLPK